MRGEHIAGYRILARLGCGGCGCVYLGQHLRLSNRFVAIKIFTGNVESEEEQTRFLQEAFLLNQLRHPHILPILDSGIEADRLRGDLPYLITEYAPNGSLRDRLEARAGPLRLKEALPILSQIGKALQYAHEHGVVHCDLKPENILFTEEGQALLADFGIAAILSSAKTQQGGVMGTLEYMAPEQFDDKVSTKSDQYALGCIAYELFTGRLPFRARDRSALMYQHLGVAPLPPRQLNPALPQPIDQAILKALAKDREDRYPDVAAFLAALHRGAPAFRRGRSPLPNIAQVERDERPLFWRLLPIRRPLSVVRQGAHALPLALRRRLLPLKHTHDWSVIVAGPFSFSLLPFGVIQLERKIDLVPLVLTALGVFFLFGYMLTLIIRSCRARDWKWAFALEILLVFFLISFHPAVFWSGLFWLSSGLNVIGGIVYGWEHAPDR